MKRGAIVVIANACIWGLVMILTAQALKGTGAFEKIQLTLSGGAAASLIVVASGILRKSE